MKKMTLSFNECPNVDAMAPELELIVTLTEKAKEWLKKVRAIASSPAFRELSDEGTNVKINLMRTPAETLPYAYLVNGKRQSFDCKIDTVSEEQTCLYIQANHWGINFVADFMGGEIFTDSVEWEKLVGG